MEIHRTNHLALATSHMGAHGPVLSRRTGHGVVATTGNRTGSYPVHHYFFKLGPHTTRAFFEWSEMVEPFHKPIRLLAKGRW